MGYSRENKRQNDALQSILDGGTPEKRIMVAMEDVNEKRERKKLTDKEREEASARSDALKAARMPWFCPKCDKIMKKNVDNKMYRLYNHCADCQVEFENRLAIDGKYNEWVENIERENKLAWIKDQRQGVEEFKNEKAPEFWEQFRPDGYSVDKETWEMDIDLMKERANEYLEHLQKIEDSLK